MNCMHRSNDMLVLALVTSSYVQNNLHLQAAHWQWQHLAAYLLVPATEAGLHVLRPVLSASIGSYGQHEITGCMPPCCSPVQSVLAAANLRRRAQADWG